MEVSLFSIALLSSIPIMIYLVLFFTVKSWGIPRFARGWPLIVKSFKLKITVFEKRANTFFPVETLGRQFTNADKTETLQTLFYGDFPNVPQNTLIAGRYFDHLYLEMDEYGEIYPLTIKEVEDRMKFIPIPQENKIYFRNQVYIAGMKYKPPENIWSQMKGILGIIIICLFSLVILWETWGNYNQSLKNLEKIEQTRATELTLVQSIWTIINQSKIYQPFNGTPSFIPPTQTPPVTGSPGG
jgi:hypothetical protein